MSKYKILYKPKGKAAEYCEGYALNLYRGCGHGCKYCYAPAVLRMKKDEFFGNPQPRKNALENLKHDIDEMIADNDIQEVFLSFTSDPFQPIEFEHGLSLKATILLEDNNIPYRILTKTKTIPGMLADGRTDLCTIGSTLVFADDSQSEKFEPDAPKTSERIAMLKRAHDYGYRTWVSLEPVWSPNDAVNIIAKTCKFVDKYKIGKLNYHPHAKEVDWESFAYQITEYCKMMQVDFELKEDLAKLL